MSERYAGDSQEFTKELIQCFRTLGAIALRYGEQRDSEYGPPGVQEYFISAATVRAVDPSSPFGEISYLLEYNDEGQPMPPDLRIDFANDPTGKRKHFLMFEQPSGFVCDLNEGDDSHVATQQEAAPILGLTSKLKAWRPYKP